MIIIMKNDCKLSWEKNLELIMSYIRCEYSKLKFYTCSPLHLSVVYTPNCNPSLSSHYQSTLWPFSVAWYEADNCLYYDNIIIILLLLLYFSCYYTGRSA